MRRRSVLTAAAALLLAGSFFVGVGTAGFIAQIRAEQSELAGNGRAYSLGELLRGDAGESPWERDQRNALLAENMRYVSMEREIKFEAGNRAGYAGIANEPESSLGCQVEIIRDATGETLYQSRLIEPGFYIEEITLKAELRKGYYPCTAVWSFYEKETDQPVGKTAGKIIVIIEN